MGNVLGNIIYDIADRIRQQAEKRTRKTNEKKWLENPEFRKLVPVPKCPNCKCRLDGLPGEDSDSGDEVLFPKTDCKLMVPSEEKKAEVLLKCEEVKIEVKGREDHEEEVNVQEALLGKSKVAEVNANRKFVEGIPLYIE